MLRFAKLQVLSRTRMNMHKNARLTPQAIAAYDVAVMPIWDDAPK
jgi:hypothetical protein